jgi:hypothetical protein
LFHAHGFLTSGIASDHFSVSENFQSCSGFFFLCTRSFGFPGIEFFDTFAKVIDGILDMFSSHGALSVATNGVCDGLCAGSDPKVRKNNSCAHSPFLEHR